MIEFSVKADVHRAIRKLDAAAKKQVPFATAFALTRTAQKAQSVATDELRRSFISPMPQTQRSIFIVPAKKATLTAVVGIKDKAPSRGIAPAKYLQAQLAGGQRVPKRVELALIHEGVLPMGMRVVPARGQKLDRFGNLPGLLYKRILADLRFVGPRARAARFFVVPPGEEAHPGIYQESGVGRLRKAKAVLLFVGAARYTVKFPFETIVHRAVQTHFPREFDNAMRQASLTAR